MHVSPKTNKDEIQVLRMQHKILCANPCFEVFLTKLHFGGSTDTKIEKLNTNVSKDYHQNYCTDIFRYGLLDEIMECGF
jgi:hypothetical protein